MQESERNFHEKTFSLTKLSLEKIFTAEKDFNRLT